MLFLPQCFRVEGNFRPRDRREFEFPSLTLTLGCPSWVLIPSAITQLPCTYMSYLKPSSWLRWCDGGKSLLLLEALMYFQALIHKGLSSQSCGFSSSHVDVSASLMDVRVGHKEGWAPKNWCFWTVVLERTPESPLDCKEIQPVNPKGNQSWIFIGRTEAEASNTLTTWYEELTHLKRPWC